MARHQLVAAATYQRAFLTRSVPSQIATPVGPMAVMIPFFQMKVDRPS
ncbi:MAG TPA: hypothetical protein VKD71_12940 [Gemmataceae bacterium]|nr:hypothetical protein [Gemmataceae bacterium]